MKQGDYKKGSISHWDKDWLGKKSDFNFRDPRDDWGYFDSFKARYLEKLILKDKNVLCLECGCGSASVSVYFANKGVKTVMLDASYPALNIARGNFSNYNLRGLYINGNMESLPFSDDKFDIVMSFGVLEHFEDMRGVIAEMKRVLKKRGTFFASVCPKRYSIQIGGNLINTFMRFLYNLKHLRFKEAFFNSYPAKPGFFENSYSADEYIDIMQSCGFLDVKLSGSRPFPSLDLTPYLFKAYILIMRYLKPLHILFEKYPSKITELIAAEWNIIATKE